MTRKNTEGRYNTPKRSLLHKPNSNSVYFANEFINTAAIAIKAGVSTSAISMIFSGKREPSLKVTEKIAIALNMDLSVFVRRLREHTELKSKYSTPKNKQS